MSLSNQAPSKALILAAKYSAEISVRQEQFHQSLVGLIEQATSLPNLTPNASEDKIEVSMLDIAKQQSNIIKNLLGALKLATEFINIQASAFTLVSESTDIENLLTASLSNLDKELSEFQLKTRHSNRQIALNKQIRKLKGELLDAQKTADNYIPRCRNS